MTDRHGSARSGSGSGMGSPRVSDEAVEQFVGRLLQVGVLLSALVVTVGGAMLLAASAGAPVSYSVFRSEPAALRSVSAIIAGAFALDVHAIVQLGLVLLVATPIARVALTLGAFAIQRDHVYMGITAVVLLLLLFSLLQ